MSARSCDWKRLVHRGVTVRYKRSSDRRSIMVRHGELERKISRQSAGIRGRPRPGSRTRSRNISPRWYFQARATGVRVQRRDPIDAVRALIDAIITTGAATAAERIEVEV